MPRFFRKSAAILAWPGLRPGARFLSLLVRHGVPSIACAMENDAAAAAVEVVKGYIEIDTLGIGECRDHPGKKRGGGEVGPDGHRPLSKALAAIGYELGRIGTLLDAKPLTDRAPAQRAVE